ncbi:MAG: hypothetical protein RL329_4087 [Bacteroidota bacterium]|jgi:hypothetical protein
MTNPKSEIYEALSRTRIRVNDQIFENEIHISVRQTILDQSGQNSIVGIEVLSFAQTAQDAFSVLLEDLNALNQHLIFERDAEGNILQITNFQDLPNRWTKLKGDLREKYGQSDEMESFFKAFDQNLGDEALLLHSMKHKGIYGVLFSGMNLTQNANNQRFRIMNQFIENVDLPLVMQAEVSAVLDNFESYQCVNCSGILDEERFEEDAFKQALQNMTQQYYVEMPAIEVHCGEMYAFRQADGCLSKAQQYLHVAASHEYEYEIGWLLMLTDGKQEVA